MERMKLVVWKDTLMTNLASRAWILLSLKVALTFWSHYFSLWRIKLFCLDVDLRRLKESFTSISKNELSPGLATHYSTPIKTKWSTLISLRVGINEKKSAKIQLFSDEKISKAATYVLRHMDENDEVWSCFSLRVCERYSPGLCCLKLGGYKMYGKSAARYFSKPFLAWTGSRSLSTFELEVPSNWVYFDYV